MSSTLPTSKLISNTTYNPLSIRPLHQSCVLSQVCILENLRGEETKTLVLGKEAQQTQLLLIPYGGGARGIIPVRKAELGGRGPYIYPEFDIESTLNKHFLNE